MGVKEHSARHGDEKTDTNTTKRNRAHACRKLSLKMVSEATKLVKKKTWKNKSGQYIW